MGDLGGEGAGLPLRAVAMATVDPLAMAWKELNDIGNAARFVARAAGRIIHVREWGWVAYDGAHWSADDGARLATLTAHEVARGIRDEIDALQAMTDDQAKGFGDWCTEAFRKERAIKLHQHSVTSGNASKTKAMLDQAAALDVLNRRMDSFDRDPLVINCTNKSFRFVRRADADKEGRHWQVEEADHDPAHLLTRVTTTSYEPQAKCPRWLEHLEQCLPDPAIRRFFQVLMGYAMLGRTDEQIFVMLQGRGGDGKSTTMNVIRILLGSYAIAAAVETFLDTGMRSGADASPDLMRFAGDTRLICIGEPKRAARLAEERVKQFTGDSPVQARPMYGEMIEFDPRGLVVLECNAKPRISGDDDGIWRRIIVVPWKVQFKGVARDRGRKRRLLEEAPGVLNWLIEGAREWLEKGLVVPDEIVGIVEEYRRSANPFGEWMAARVDLSDANALTPVKDLYEDYKEFCAEDGISDRDILNSTAFGRALGDRQINLGPKTRKGNKQRRGAKLRPKGDDLGFDGGTGLAGPGPAAAPTSGAFGDHGWGGDDGDLEPA